MFQDGCFPLLGDSASPLFPSGKTSGHFFHFPTHHSFEHKCSAASTTGCGGSSMGHVTPSPITAVALCFQLDISPGYCWPFQASESQVVFRLPAQVQPTAITVQHPLKRCRGLGDINNALRDFTVSVSLCWTLGAGLQAWEKTCNGGLLLSVVSPKHCCAPRGHFRERAGWCHPILRLAF